MVFSGSAEFYLAWIPTEGEWANKRRRGEGLAESEAEIEAIEPGDGVGGLM